MAGSSRSGSTADGGRLTRRGAADERLIARGYTVAGGRSVAWRGALMSD